MPGLRLLLHELDAVPLARPGDDRRRLLACRGVGQLVERLLERGDVVPVDLLDPPAEGLEPLAERLDVHRQRGRAGPGEPVGVHDGDQVAQLVVRRGHRGLPHLPFLQLAVAGQHERPVVPAGQPSGQRHPGADAEVVPEGAGGEVDAGSELHVRVVVERRADLAELLEQRLVVEAEVGEDGPEPGRHVALAEQEPVPVGPARLAGAQPQRVVIQRRDDLRAGEGGGIVAEPRLRDQVDRLQPDPVRSPGELGIGSRPPALQDDVFWHEVSLDSAQLVDNMRCDQRRWHLSCARAQHRSRTRQVTSDRRITVRQADDYVLGRQDCRAATAGSAIVTEAIRELAGQAVDMLAGRDQLCTTAAWSHQTPV